jgi:glutathione peroxidase
LASLQNLYELYQDRLIVVAIPCDQFFHQTPGNASEIKSFCEKNYAITFLLTEKVFVT